MVRVMEIARDALTLKIEYSIIFGRLLSTLLSINIDNIFFYLVGDKEIISFLLIFFIKYVVGLD